MAIWSYLEIELKNITVVEAKSRFSALLAEVEAGEEIVVTRHGKAIARLIPDRPRMAADAFRDLWLEDGDVGIDIEAPEDEPAEDVVSLDD